MGDFPKINEFPALLSLSKEFPKSEIFLVGGVVRDCIIGKKTTDIDIVIRNVPGDELEEFLAQQDRVVFAGKNFGVFKFNEIGRPRNEIYDIALPRTEFSMHKQGIYKDFKIKTNPRLPIEEDLKRRDFTINAIAYDLLKEKIIDPHKGSEDIKNKIIRSVGSPSERFQEDYSRMLRAIRFSVQLDFEIESKTGEEIKKMIPNINKEIDDKRVVPFEVISEELLKSLKALPSTAIRLWDEYRVLSKILPELSEMKGCPQPENWHTEGDVWKHTMLALEKLYSNEFKKEFPEEEVNIELIVSVLFHDIGKPYTIEIPNQASGGKICFNNHDVVGAKITKNALERIKASSPENIGINIDSVSWLVGHHMVLVHGDPKKMRPDTIEKYFFNQNKPTKNLMKLILIDGLASITEDGKNLTGKFYALQNRIEKIKKITKSHGNNLASPFINGNDIIKILKLEPSPEIGKILRKARDKQLKGEIKSRQEALEYLKNYGN